MTKLTDLLKASQRVTFLTGAGVSTASGIPDFQSTDAQWAYSRPRHELIALPYFKQNPRHFWKVYREVFDEKFGGEPNGAHRWIAALEKTHEVTVITQNIDGLHQKAGSSKVLEVHGNNEFTLCRRGCTPTTMAAVAHLELPRCPICNAVLRPAVSLFRDAIYHFEEAKQATLAADLFIVMGTSLAVSPVNQLPLIAGDYRSIPVVWLNKDSPDPHHEGLFTHGLVGDVSSVDEERNLSIFPRNRNLEDPFATF